MKGSTFKRCTCPAAKDAKDKRVNCSKKHGSWSYVADIGIDEQTGKRLQEKRGGFRTQNDAQEALNLLLAKVREGTYVPDSSLTVGQWLTQWVDEREADGLIRPGTAHSYRGHIRRYLTPALGRIKLRDLRAGHVQKLLRDLKAPNRSATTILRVHATLRSALSTAVKRRMISMNAAKDLELPKLSSPKVHPWEPWELGAFLDSVAAHPLGPLFEVIASAGLRRGEGLGLRWSDVDLTARTLTVRQQVTQAHQAICPVCGEHHSSLSFGKPKTAAGEDRVVELDDMVVGILLAVRLAQDEERDEWDDAYREHDLVFARPGGDPMRPNDVSLAFADLIDAVRFPEDAHLPDGERRRLRHVRLHDLRHGHASLMLAAKIDMTIVSKRLGHSKVSITSDLYSHLLEGVGRAAAEAASALVPRKPRDQSVTNPADAQKSAMRPGAVAPAQKRRKADDLAEAP